MKPTNIMKAASALALGSLLCTHTALAAEGDTLFETTFDTDTDFENWFDNNDKMKEFGWDGTTITGEEMVLGGVFAAKVTQGTNNDAQIVTNTGSGSLISLDADIVGSMTARIRQSSDDGATWVTAGALTGLLAQVQGTVINGAAITQAADETVLGDGWTIVTFDAFNVFGKTITNVRIDPSGTLEESFEVDYIRLLETEVAPPIFVEIDPGTGIPGGYNLVKEWDTAVQLADLTPIQLEKFDTTPGVDIGACSNNAAEDCASGFTTGGDSQLNTPGGLSIPVALGNNMIVEIGIIAVGGNTTDSELLWQDDDNMGGANRVGFPVITDDDALHVIRTTFAGGSGIETALKKLRFDPSRTFAGVPIEVDYIRIYTDTPLPAELFWDTDTVTAADQGGTGAWNTTNDFWYDGVSANVLWPAVPTGDDNATFGGTAGVATIDAGGITAHSLKFTVDGYTIDGGDLILDSSASDASIEVDGGSVTASIESLIDGTDDVVRKIGNGTLVLDNDNIFNSFVGAGGTVTIPTGASLTTTTPNPGENNFGLKLTNSTILNIDGTVDADDGSFGGFSGDGNWTVNVNAGAILNISNAYAGWNTSVTYNFNDGTTNATGFLRHQDGGDPTINVFGGTHTFGGQVGALTNGGGSDTVLNITGGTLSAGSVQFSPSNTANGTGSNSYTINLDGGTLDTSRVSIRRGTAPDDGGTNTLNVLFNGGVLRAQSGGGSATLIDGNIGTEVFTSTTVYNATVETGGAIIDTNGECKSVDQPLVVGAASGGSLTKNGLGALYLNEINTYDGGTSVTAGTLGGEGEVAGDVTVDPGAGLAYFETDPGLPTGGLFINGSLTLPSPLVISIDSGNGPFVETSAVGLIIADASSIVGSPTFTVDTTKFGGFGTWSNPRIAGTQVLIDYTAGSNPFASYMNGFYPGETDPLIVGPNADPDGDGVSNFKEYAFGGDPSDNANQGPGNNGVNNVSGTDYFTRTVAVRTGAIFSGTGPMTASQDGVDYSIDGSVDLLSFASDLVEVAAITAGLPTAPTGYEYKTFRTDPGVATGGKGFIGCSVTETP